MVAVAERRLTDSETTSNDWPNNNEGEHAEAKSAAEKMSGIVLFVTKFLVKIRSGVNTIR